MNKNDKQHALVPRLRFPEFRNANAWQEVTVRKVATVIAGQSPRGEYYNDIGEGTPFYQGKTDFGNVFIDPPTKWTKQVTTLANEGDILMSVRAPVGALNVSTQEICIGRGLASLQAKEDKWFLYYLLLQVNHLFVGNGGSVFDSINKSQIESTKIPFPPTPAEQQKIAECLGSLDDWIAAEGRKLAALRDHKKGLMQQLFPREGETRPRLRFPECLDGPEWRIVPLGDLVEIASGQVDPTQPPFCDLPHVGSDNIESHSGYLSGLQTANELQLISGKYSFDQRDILYSKIRPALNKVAAPAFKGICSADIYPIRPSKAELRRDYLYYLLLCDEFLTYAIKHSARSKIPKLNRATILGYEAPVPIAAEQRRIANCLSALDALIAAQTEKLDALRTHTRGLMQQLFPSLEDVEA